MEDGRSSFKILTGKFTGERLRRRWEDSVRMDVKEMGVNMRNCFDLAQDRD